MRHADDKHAEKAARGKRKRLASLIAAAVMLLAGALAVLNLVATKADGASTEDQQQADSGTDQQEATAADEESEEGGEPGNEKAPVPVEVSAVEQGTVSAYISSTANLVAEFEVQVLAEVDGRILSLAVEEGDLVRKGQVLATLVPDDQEINVKKAQLRAANARMAYERARDLVDKELISREEFDKLEIEHGIAEQELAEAEWALSRTSIRAPFSGRVTRRTTQVGQHVQVADELFQVTDFDPLVARIYLPERDVLGLEEGRQVRLRLNAANGVEFEGRIRQISPIVDTATGTIKITIEASNVPAGVRPGSFVTVAIVRETRADALLVPREAVLRELQRAHVFVAQDDVAQKRAVTLGIEEGDYIEALSGVRPGDTVIVAGQGGLRDGSPVKVLTIGQNAG